MATRRSIWAVAGAGALAAALVVAAVGTGEKAGGAGSATTAPAGGQVSAAVAEDLSAGLKALDAAAKAVEGGDKALALAELTKARRLVGAAHQALIRLIEAQPVVNVRCPITGDKIDPAKVPGNLTRVYKGQKVGFCCAGCPEQWDRLTDAERDAKLKTAGQGG